MLLRIVLFEVSEEGGLGEMLQAGGVVGHLVGVAWEVEGFEEVAVLALVLASELTQVSGHPVTGDGAAGHSGNGGSVVRTHRQGGASHRVAVRHVGGVPLQPGVLQVAVGDFAVRVGDRHQALLDGRGKREAPHEGLAVLVEVDAAHAGLGGVGRPEVGRVLADDLG